MATELTPEQRSDLARHGNRPVVVVDPETHAVYYLVAGDSWERLRALWDDDHCAVAETYSSQSAVAGISGWDDPEMDRYDDYDRHKRPT